MPNLSQHFYRGPNLWFPDSAMLVTMAPGPASTPAAGTGTGLAQEPWLAARDTPGVDMAAALSRAAAWAHEHYPVVREQPWADEATLHDIGQRPYPMLSLMVRVFESLVRDFCVRPAVGRVVRQQPGSNQHMVVLPCDDGPTATRAWDTCMRLAQAACAGATALADTAGLAADYAQMRTVARARCLNQSTMAVVRAAAALDIPAYRLDTPGQFVQLGQGRHRQRIRETGTERTSVMAQWITHDKLLTVRQLADFGLPTPGTRHAATAEDAVRIARELGQVVVKPRDSGKGKGVTVNISGDERVRQAFQYARTAGSAVIVERYIAGDDHRLLVVAGRLVAAARRLPGHVVGDGRHTVAELVDIANQDPRRGMSFERLLERLELDAESDELLGLAGMNLQTVPVAGQKVVLRRAANISRGGTSEDVTDVIHPDNAALAEHAAVLFGLDVTGIDFQTPDITRSWREVPCGILELNTVPGLRPHLGANDQRDVATPIVRHLFPTGNARVPMAGITGSLGKTTTCRLVAAVLAQAGHTVAMSTTEGASIGGVTVQGGDLAGGASATRLLRDPRVDAGVFELSRGGLLKMGMVLDRVDVGAVLNVDDNHVGIDGIRSRADLAVIKRLVVANARDMAVLNADDPLCLAMRDHTRAARLCLVSPGATATIHEPAGQSQALLARHRARGGVAAWLQGTGADATLHLAEGERTVGQLAAARIPVTLGGVFQPGLSNALFAMAIAHGLRMPFDAIAAALEAFVSTPATNPGRMNFSHGLPWQLLSTWADGPRAYAELVRLVRTLPARRRIVCMTAAGNRPDAYLRATGAAVAGAFDHYIFMDWTDLRGRASGATPALLREGLTQGPGGGAGAGIIAEVIADQVQALARAFTLAGPGDLIVTSTPSHETAWRMAHDMASGRPAPAPSR